MILIATLSPLCEGDEGEESKHILPLSGDGDVLQLSLHFATVISAYAETEVGDGYSR